MILGGADVSFFVFFGFGEGTTRFRADLSCFFRIRIIFRIRILFWRGGWRKGGIEKMTWSVPNKDTSR